MCNLIINWFFLTYATCRTEWKTILTIWLNMKARRLQKSQFSNSLVIWERFGKVVYIGYSKIPFFHLVHELGKPWKYTQCKTSILKSKFWVYGWIGKVISKTSLLNKMEVLYIKKWWSHFKLNLNDWDIPFPKMFRSYQWIQKNIFHWKKWKEPVWSSPHSTECSAYVCKSIAFSEWTQETQLLILSPFLSSPLPLVFSGFSR